MSSKNAWFNFDFEDTLKVNDEPEHLSLTNPIVEKDTNNVRKEPEKRMGFGMGMMPTGGVTLKKVEKKPAEEQQPAVIKSSENLATLKKAEPVKKQENLASKKAEETKKIEDQVVKKADEPVITKSEDIQKVEEPKKVVEEIRNVVEEVKETQPIKTDAPEPIIVKEGPIFTNKEEEIVKKVEEIKKPVEIKSLVQEVKNHKEPPKIDSDHSILLSLEDAINNALESQGHSKYEEPHTLPESPVEKPADKPVERPVPAFRTDKLLEKTISQLTLTKEDRDATLVKEDKDNSATPKDDRPISPKAQSLNSTLHGSAELDLDQPPHSPVEEVKYTKNPSISSINSTASLKSSLETSTKAEKFEKSDHGGSVSNFFKKKRPSLASSAKAPEPSKLKEQQQEAPILNTTAILSPDTKSTTSKSSSEKVASPSPTSSQPHLEGYEVIHSSDVPPEPVITPEPVKKTPAGLDKKMGFGNILANGFSLKRVQQQDQQEQQQNTPAVSTGTSPLQRLKSVSIHNELHLFFVHLNPLLITPNYYENISQIFVTPTHCFAQFVNVKPIQKMQFVSQIKEFCINKKIQFVEGIDDVIFSSTIKDTNTVLKASKMLMNKSTLGEYAPKLENSRMFHISSINTPAGSQQSSPTRVSLVESNKFMIHQGKPSKSILNQYGHCFITTPIGHFIFIKRQKTSQQTTIVDAYKDFVTPTPPSDDFIHVIHESFEPFYFKNVFDKWYV